MSDDSEDGDVETQVLDGDVLLLVLRGGLDALTSLQFESEVLTHLEAGHSKIIIDCRHLGHISSLGIGSLVRLQTRLRRQGGEVKLAAVQGPVMNLLRLVRLDKFFDIHGDSEFARQSFRKGGATGEVAAEQA